MLRPVRDWDFLGLSCSEDIWFLFLLVFALLLLFCNTGVAIYPYLKRGTSEWIRVKEWAVPHQMCAEHLSRRCRGAECRMPKHQRHRWPARLESTSRVAAATRAHICSATRVAPPATHPLVARNWQAHEHEMFTKFATIMDGGVRIACIATGHNRKSCPLLV